MSRLVTVVTSVDEPEWTKECIKWLKENSTPELNTIVLLDNGSYEPLPDMGADVLLRWDKNYGANAVFHRMLPELNKMNAEFVAYLHCDLMVREKGWDMRVVEGFDAHPQVALMGFVGSNEIDMAGGRGLGTVLNYQGHEYPFGKAVPAKVHGRPSRELEPCAVLDHCSMIFRIRVLGQLTPQEGNYSPGHFYDRIVCCETLYRGHRIAYIGIECDHFSGGTRGGVRNRDEFYSEWLESEGIPYNVENPDMSVYKEGEKRFLSRWRDEIKFIPLRVESDWSITFRHPQSRS